MIKRGDTVTFKPEWRDAGDENITFIAVDDEYQDDTGPQSARVLIEAQLDMTLNPTNVVPVYMIETVTSKGNA